MDWQRRVFEFGSRGGLVQGAPVCWRFWAQGPGYPYGILELGSCPSWQGGNTVWAELVRGFKLGKAAAGRLTRQAESGGLASDQGRYFWIKGARTSITMMSILSIPGFYAMSLLKEELNVLQDGYMSIWKGQCLLL